MPSKYKKKARGVITSMLNPNAPPAVQQEYELLLARVEFLREQRRKWADSSRRVDMPTSLAKVLYDFALRYLDQQIEGIEACWGLRPRGPTPRIESDGRSVGLPRIWRRLHRRQGGSVADVRNCGRTTE